MSQDDKPSGAKSTPDSDANSAADSAANSTADSDTNSAAKSDAKSTANSATKSTPDSAANSDTNSAADSAAESTLDSDAKSTADSAAKSTADSDAKSTADSATNSALNSGERPHARKGALSSASADAPITKSTRGVTHEVTFGKAYDARLVKRLAHFFKPHKALLVGALISYPFVSGLNLLQPYFVKVAVDEHLVPKNMNGFGWVILGLLIAVTLEFGAKFAQTILTQLLGQRVTRDLRVKLFEKLQQVDLSYVESNPVGRLMTRVTNDVESLTETFSSGAVSIVGDIFLLVGIVVMMFWLDWRLTLFAFSVLPFLGIFVSVMRRYAREAFRRVRTILSQLNGYLNEAISGMTVIQSFRQEEGMAQEFDDVNRSYRDANFDSIRYDATTYAVVEALSTMAIALLLMFGLGMFETGAVEIGTFVAFVDYLRRFFYPINELSTKYTMLQSAMAAAERCVDLLDQEPRVVETKNPKKQDPLHTALAFEDVCFSYSEDGQRVLHHLDLKIARGEKVAIVGPTGSGKSTIVKLVARFYDPVTGKITLDGTPLTELAVQDLRSRLAVVLQDSHLFDGTIEDNVRFGRPDASLETLEQAARRTRAWDVVNRHSDGWKGRVGERGALLSVGERQLLSFARALVLDPEILVLDEATSSVDPATEALIQAGLEELVKNRTAIIIAHRLSTIRSADRIVVLVKGKIVEQGSHAELLELGGIYRNLYELQFAEPEAPSAQPDLQPA